MSNIVVRKRRGTTTSLSSLLPQTGEIYIDITKPTLVIGDGATAGGVPLAKENHTHAAATESTPGFLSATDKTKLDALSSAGGYVTIQSNGGGVAQEGTINFSADFTVTDDHSFTRTDVALSNSFFENQDSNIIALVLALT